MQCNDYKEQLFDVVTGDAGPEVKAHFTSCRDCASELESMRKTMALLDDWKAPQETSPYFMTRLMARVRDESANAAASSGWLAWFRKPALAISFAAVLVAGLTFLRTDTGNGGDGGKKVDAHSCAVTDLQFLDKNDDVLQNLEVLDDIQDGSPALQRISNFRNGKLSSAKNTAMSGPFKNSVRWLAGGVLAVSMTMPVHAWQGQNQRRNNEGARQQNGDGQRFRGSQMGNWLRENRGKSFDQQKRSLESDPDFKTLPPDRQEKLKQRLQDFNQLSPQQQDRVLNRFDKLNRMSPQQRAQARALLDRMRLLPEERRIAIRRYFHSLVNMPRLQRQQVLGSQQFNSQFNPDEREIIQRGLELNDENGSQDVGDAPR